MNRLSRRQFVGLVGGAAAAAALPRGFAEETSEGFEFVFLTDTHTQPELDAVHGTDLAMRAASKVKADFAIQGGDHVMDLLAVAKPRATQILDLYAKTEQDLGMKVHHTLGNHDNFGVYTASGVLTSDPEYGKKMFMERFGPTYYSFDHKGVHFVVLDSIGIKPSREYEARIDDAQLAWLAKDLAAQGATKPIVVVTHIPLVTAVPNYFVPKSKDGFGEQFWNGPATIKLFEGHNVLGVLQGHTHVNERVEWHGVPYITSGAVSGNWWKGTRLGTPEGFTVVTIEGGKLRTRYEVSGFRSVAPDNT